MCTKTKTSYGCGHVLKTKDSCGDIDCVQVDKYHFQKDTDCASCRSGGNNVTRGRDGQGRYGQRKHRSEGREATPPPPPPTNTASRQHRPDRIDISGGASPWSPENNLAKPWDSPIRKNADHAWLDEHDSRIADLQDLVEKYSISSKSSRNASPNTSNDRIAMHGDEPFPPKLRYAKTMPLPYEFQNLEYDSAPRSDRRSRRSRKASQRSEDSMPEYFEGPTTRFRKVDYATSSSDRDIQGRRRHRNHGAKTEPYAYARSYLYESPLSASPVDGGYYPDQYEVVQPPQYGYTYPRGHR